MLETRPQPRRRTSSRTRRVVLSACISLCATYAAACRNGFEPLPRGDGPLTGTWIQPSIDTWVQLDLSQSGSRVVGYYRTGSANGGGSLSDPIRITGTAALPQATLQWTDNDGGNTMNVTLSADGDPLTGTWSFGGRPPAPFFGFHRSTP
jgi:hypothetical protein